MASISMSFACILVGFGSLPHDENSKDSTETADEDGKDDNTGLVLELIGVSFMSFQCSLGEVRSVQRFDN
jgi:hypothetical protein